MWLVYFFFIIGFNSKRKFTGYNLRCKSNIMKVYKVLDKRSSLLFWGIISIIISIICAYYYTGKLPLQVIQNILLNRSNYNEYQLYFNKKNIYSFSIQKIPFILLLGLKNIIFVYGYILTICRKEKINFKNYFFLLILAIAHLYFGIARGTNFETYQLFLLIIYCYVNRMYLKKEKPNIIIIIILGFILTLVFFIVLEARGAKPNYNIAARIIYDSQAFFSLIFPRISLYYLFLHSYLGFGLYYISTLLNEVYLDSFQGLIQLLIPGVNYFIDKTPIEITNEIVVIGVKWVPDAATIINNIGLIGLLIICYKLGGFFSKLKKRNKVENGYRLIFGYLIFVFLVSIPNGHFVTFSSEKILIAYTVYNYWLDIRK